MSTQNSRSPIILAINHVVKSAVPPSYEPNTHAFWAHFKKLSSSLFPLSEVRFKNGTVALAFANGFDSDRLAFAFASGYQCALENLFGQFELESECKTNQFIIRAICVSEKGGAHPRKIQTSAVYDQVENQWVLNGRKTFVTLGPFAQRLYVLAKVENSHKRASFPERPQDRVQFKMFSVSTQLPGVQVLAHDKKTPFAPELVHGSAIFSNARVNNQCVLPGDGYSHYAKVFRTIEDIHVQAALVGFLVRLARHEANPPWDNNCIESLLAAFLSLYQVAEMDPSLPSTHLALSGISFLISTFIDLVEVAPSFAILENKYDQINNADGGNKQLEYTSMLQTLPVDIQNRWVRDQMLLKTAERARSARRKKAWKQLQIKSSL